MKISAEHTASLKNLYPISFFVLFVVLLMVNGSSVKEDPVVFLVICAVVMLGYFVVYSLTYELMDEVFDHGEYLELRFKGKEETVYVNNIVSVNSSSSIYAGPRITLVLRVPCKFGRTIFFSPTPEYGLNAFKKNRVAEDLKSRVDSVNN